MSTLLETDETGALHLPPELLPHAAPHRQYLVETENGRVLVQEAPVAGAFWQTATPEERAADILRWAESHHDGRNLPDAALGRDAIYD